MLLSSPICNVNAMDNDQTTPLIMAALQGNAIICESLVSVWMDKTQELTQQMIRQTLNELSISIGTC